jgi:hypothetical protein
MTYLLAPGRRILLAVIVAAASAGCLRSTTTIDLKADGSGTVVQETAVSAQAMGMLQGLAGSNAQAGEKPPQLFGEEQARKAAATMGVTFVSGEPFKSGDLEGYRARYSFTDISKVSVKMDQTANDLGASSSSTSKPPFAFGFSRAAAASTLTIQMPEQTAGAPVPLPGAATSDAEKAQAAQGIAMMKMMMRGLYVDVALNVDGRIIKTNAPYVEGSRITLMQIDLDKLLSDDAALQKLQTIKDVKGLAEIPGFKIVAEPKVTVEFGR